MTIVFLEAKDLELRMNDQVQQKALCLNPNISHNMTLVYFFLAKCKYCTTVTPFIHSLPGLLKGMTFAIVNAANIMPQLSELNSNTYFPIKEVPNIILYSGSGWPIERYTGPCTLESVKNFIVAVQQKMIASNAQQSQPAPPPAPTSVPHNPNRVCYLTYCEAYEKRVKPT